MAKVLIVDDAVFMQQMLANILIVSVMGQENLVKKAQEGLFKRCAMS